MSDETLSMEAIINPLALEDEDRYRLLYGPYNTPPVALGDWLEDVVRGPIRVSRWSKGRITWPATGTTPKGQGRQSLILCGDLVKAIEHESLLSIVYWWGISQPTATRWRRLLNVERKTLGTARLHREWMPNTLKSVHEAARVKGRRNAATPQSRLKATQTRRANGFLPAAREWLLEEDCLLGTMSDKQVAQKVNRSSNQIYLRRVKLGVPAFGCPVVDTPPRETVLVNSAALLKRRFQLQLSLNEMSRRIDYSRSWYSYRETGAIRSLTPEALLKIARALECEPEELISII